MLYDSTLKISSDFWNPSPILQYVAALTGITLSKVFLRSWRGFLSGERGQCRFRPFLWSTSGAAISARCFGPPAHSMRHNSLVDRLKTGARTSFHGIFFLGLAISRGSLCLDKLRVIKDRIKSFFPGLVADALFSIAICVRSQMLLFLWLPLQGNSSLWFQSYRYLLGGLACSPTSYTGQRSGTIWVAVTITPVFFVLTSPEELEWYGHSESIRWLLALAVMLPLVDSVREFFYINAMINDTGKCIICGQLDKELLGRVKESCCKNHQLERVQRGTCLKLLQQDWPCRLCESSRSQEDVAVDMSE